MKTRLNDMVNNTIENKLAMAELALEKKKRERANKNIKIMKVGRLPKRFIIAGKAKIIKNVAALAAMKKKLTVLKLTNWLKKFEWT